MRFLAYTGTLDFDDGVDPAMLAAHLTECLRAAGACSVRAGPGIVGFSGGFYRVLPWHMLVPFERGEVIVDESTHEVRYRLSVAHVAIAITLMMAWMGVTAWQPMKHSLILLFIVPIGWLWLFVPNVLFGARRFEEFLRRAIDSAPAKT
ncbi:hypothetical protein [Paludibaculum fermentans]|uniref:Uncharacterized protein n=1 Tax=Paludibaculum fermentans TaxID=1473598 RepID=A0A7S7SNI5_PALFE|nr:hypothetical protein [Paludibaculum fermentans]QOY91509.1 hypothetical protein IRI77_16645 [Paludibaculum fermentans]